MEILAKVFMALLVGALIAVLMALPVMWLWNAVVPEIFGLTEIGFGQSLGISALSSLLFKGSTSSGG